MPIPVEAYTMAGIIRGVIPRAGPLREVLEHDSLVAFDRATFAPLGGRARPEVALSLEPDELLLVSDDSPDGGPVHALWHPLRLVTGPYRVEGELATMPGFDPARSLTRPTGTWVRLRDVVVSERDTRDREVGRHAAVLVHRYEVEWVESDLMLTLTFPGAEVAIDTERAGTPG
jgi:hypothetical protein